MTARQLFEFALIELNKVQAPSLLLEDYNYFINKAVNQYINKVYNLYEVNQQKSDDLRVLKSTASLTPTIQNDLPYDGSSTPIKNKLFQTTYEVNLPDDYLHILNCVVEYQVKSRFKCYDANTYIHFGAKRLTSDMFSQIINNYYMRPSYKNPYFYINNVTIDTSRPTSESLVPVEPDTIEITFLKSASAISIPFTIVYNGMAKVFNYTNTVGDSNFLSAQGLVTLLGASPLNINASITPIGDTWVVIIPKEFASNVTVVNSTDESILKITNVNIDNVERVAKERYGNQSRVRMEIRYGKDDSLFKLVNVYIDYLKSPQFIRLTQEQVDQVADSSQILEFPDYVCQEIVNELIKLLMENSSDPRLQTNIPINQSIANPTQEQPQQRK